MSLEDWLAEAKLKNHVTSREEIARLLSVFDRDMKDTQAENLSLDRRFITAYNAALMAARAALAAKGYRTTGEANHLITIQSLKFTLDPEPAKISLFNRYRRKRNLSDYEMTGVVSDQDVQGVVELAVHLHRLLIEWLKGNYPELGLNE